ncbi:lysine methyltransferase 5Ab [Eucyclogobius newberryi]|uniref:lysine methyltransferase 5Ab n=1 Tax=Eucyclogobius newberryi TaxID=166745 RepID=UPI003B58D753
MAKGKQTVLRTDRKPDDSVQHKVSSSNETKENKPASSKGSQHKSLSILQSLQSPAKARSPLGQSSMLIQEANDADPTSSDSKLKKDIPTEGKCDAKEQKTPTCPEKAEKSAASELKESGGQTKVGAAKDNKAPASKNRSRAGHKKSENKAPQNKKVTDYFPIRRSNRKTKAELKIEEHRHLDDLIKNGVEDGMEVKEIEGKGRGVFAVNVFKKGDFVVEYYGDLLELSEAKAREAEYALDPSTGCYMYYFQYQTKTYCVDATKESRRLGRLINHSKNGNCQTRLHSIDGTPHLILVASRDIFVDEELLYDYGDRSKSSISAHPWLKF